MTFILSSPQLSSQRRDKASGMQLRHMQMRFTTPPCPVPETEPHWDYQTNDTTSREQMVTCLVAGLKRAAQNVVNFDKLREVQQEEKENPASFLSRLTEVL
jgi:hypothetical protein